jgi:hypothetical protein
LTTPEHEGDGLPQRAAGETEAAASFNPFRLLDVDDLDPATLDNYAVFLLGLRRTLRINAARVGSDQEPMLREFLDEVEDALRDALAARHRRR